MRDTDEGRGRGGGRGTGHHKPFGSGRGEKSGREKGMGRGVKGQGIILTNVGKRKINVVALIENDVPGAKIQFDDIKNYSTLLGNGCIAMPRRLNPKNLD